MMRAIGAAFCMGLCCAALHAQPLPPAPPGVTVTTSYGIEFVTIGDPGNAPFRDANHLGTPGFVGGGFDGQGSIGYEYRLSRTEVTYNQWLPFVQAFAPHWTGSPDDFRLTGRFIGRNAQGEYYADPARANEPAVWMSWPVAAAFCNWLHNGRGTGASAFLTGAYDLTGMDLTGATPFTGTLERQAGAQFGMPTIEEWHKGVYYDPNRHGPGQGGWWIYPGSSDSPLISGYPENGGQTSAGDGYEFNIHRPMPVAMYPGVQTPWGLFDASGGVREFTTEVSPWVEGERRTVLTTGTGAFGFLHEFFDLPGYNGGGTYYDGMISGGVRVWATVPEPAGALAVLIGVSFMRSRRSP